MSKKSIVVSGLVYTIGTILIQGLTFITLPIYTRVISQEVYGQFSLYNSWIGIVSLFIGLQLGGTLGPGWVRYREKFDDFVSTIVVSSVVFFLPIWGLSFLLSNPLSTLFGLPSWIVPLLFLQSFMNVLQGLLTTYLVQIQQSMLTLLISVLSAVVNISLSLFLIFSMENDFLARIMANSTTTGIFACISLIYFYKKIGIHFQKDYLRYGLTISIPLIFQGLGHNVLNQFDRIMLGRMLTLSDVALYSFGYTLASILQIVFTSLNTVWCPWYFEKKRNGDKDLLKYVHYYLAVGLFATLGFLTIYPELAILLGGEEYQSSIGFIPMIIVGIFFVFLYSFPANIQFYSGNTKFLPIGTLIAGLLNVSMNFVLIPTLGIYGAALTTTASYLLLLALHYRVVKRKYAYNEVAVPTFIKIVGLVVVYTGLMTAFAVSIWIRWTLGLFVLLIYGYIYRKEISLLLQKKKGK
ncbi:lipopolysaccharide biosynthesis protein [Streptococcus suis]|uniref:lipopolysaccharide biosynthesis protein n=1 Tax=Streptococcus suis TaxID=1307 RepID=UPI00211C7B8C|nr:oligosaccharide flippase family protein [Streptococcus suis]UUM59145.1 oligosaccharide flippase family protein [Streptococcus suis]HEL2327549.1 oligosaccharide flippase family protein [Streptococcus suis]